MSKNPKPCSYCGEIILFPTSLEFPICEDCDDTHDYREERALLYCNKERHRLGLLCDDYDDVSDL